MTDDEALIAEGCVNEDDLCPSTFGSESPGHCFIAVSASTSFPSPHRMCSKCGLRVTLRAHLIAKDQTHD